MPQIYDVYNLEFPSNVTELNIEGYVINANREYIQNLLELDNDVVEITSHYTNNIRYGTHVKTSKIIIPDSEKKAILPWNNDNSTRLDDVLLILSLFTSRNVFLSSQDLNAVPRISHQRFSQGGLLACSIPYETYNYSFEELSHRDITEIPNIGFEKNIRKVFSTMKKKLWKSTFKDGFYLFLFKQACESFRLEISFLQCWTIWEHFFSIHYPGRYEKNGTLKIASILNHYFNTNLNLGLRKVIINGKKRSFVIGRTKNVEKMKNIRNGLVHDGSLKRSCIRMKRQNAIRYMQFFIHLTEQLIVKTLGLTPSEALDTSAKLNKWIHGEL